MRFQPRENSANQESKSQELEDDEMIGGIEGNRVVKRGQGNTRQYIFIVYSLDDVMANCKKSRLS